MKKHVFAICAYGESQYLEACIRSIINQSYPSGVILVTATPNPHIRFLCKKYRIPIYINHGEHGITQDWNFAYTHAEATYITIAHQDDIYCRDFARCTVQTLDRVPKPILSFTDYGELRNGRKVKHNRLLWIKRLLLAPLCVRRFQSSRFVRRLVLSFGSPICCPSVTFVKKNCPSEIFQHGFRSNGDWQAWERLSKRDGAFVFCRGGFMYHRIHGDSQTSKLIGDQAREKEDLQMFCRFWPVWVARFLARLYRFSEKSNQL